MSKQAKANKGHQHFAWRFYCVLGAVSLLFVALLSRAAYIQVLDPDRLRMEGDNRSLRTKTEIVQRSLITDRNGIELAVSVPVEAVWVDPKILFEKDGLSMTRRWQALCDVLDLDFDKVMARMQGSKGKRFVYLQRQLSPAMSGYVENLKIPGVYLKSESRRFYPTGEVSAHLIGFTDIDDRGLEGLERSYDEWLTGTDGKRKVRKDRGGRVIESLEVLEQAETPHDLVLSIDQRIQALAYQELKKATEYHRATSGSVVVLDVRTGEVLAMVNTPSYNPNNRKGLKNHRTRNRAVTDTFEPGSSVKPLAVISALDAGSVQSDTVVDTSPGWMRIGGRQVRDSRDYGELDLAGILQKSSNVGVSKLALSVPVEQLLGTFYSLGFGSDTGLGLPGESSGVIHERRRWSEFEVATLSFGYGLTVTTLQLAQAYAVLGSGGLLRPLSIIKTDEPLPAKRVLDQQVARSVLTMMNAVTEEGGTGIAAQVAGYRVSGKTGTSRKAVAGGYGDDYVASFAGVAPLDNPRLAIVVVVNEPAGDRYYGGDVAAPVFGKVMAGALRALNISPDAVGDSRIAVLSGGKPDGSAR
ncbi:peptidoglycan glycosyltransferase FtsI [Corallincola holothuriorum]|uniref:Peptidoglycan D,D-transpeptidase FtsI n=1 Tax=Corallincola holothuriorum TaxID=2282215 RepID=A0A368NKE1_9GAMM|nr:penicillin-binding transpeptidase domain-containing protein [Corallincola holothuriorum]RCU49879.1 peptidoglycan glycosyltransferase FtsI [Corallincola holothuriorum]